MYKLLIEDNDRFQTVIPITGSGVTIGRDESNTVRLPERNISREHCRIFEIDDHIYFENVKARYGSEKNGHPVTKIEKFTVNDVFEVGDYCIRLEKVIEKKPTNRFDDTPTRVTQRPEIIDRHARLVVTSSNFAGQEFNLVYQSCIIGRDESCDIVIEHRSVSARHARIEHEDNYFTITDLQSSNGTVINGQLQNYQRLISGDIIELGQVTLRFIGPGENFTFVVPEAPSNSGRKMARSTAIFGLLFASLVLVIALLAVAFFSGPSQNDDSSNPSNNAVSDSLSQAISSLSDNSDNLSSKVDDAILKAQKLYDDADMLGAISTLNHARNELNPTAEQRRRINDLIDAARLEIEPSRAIISMRSNMNKTLWIKALDNYESLLNTPNSPIASKFLHDSDLRNKIINNAIRMALKGSPEDRTRVEMLLSSIDPDDPRLDKLIGSKEKNDSDDDKSRKEGRSSRRRVKRRSRSHSNDDSLPKNSAERNSFIADQTSSAMKLLFRGEHAKSIRTCKKVFKVESDNRKCRSIMGLNYEKLGDTRRACHYFQLAGAREKIRKLNCK